MIRKRKRKKSKFSKFDYGVITLSVCAGLFSVLMCGSFDLKGRTVSTLKARNLSLSAERVAEAFEIYNSKRFRD